MSRRRYRVTVENGYAKLLDGKGTFRRYICGNAVKAELKGGKVFVTTRDNRLTGYDIEPEENGRTQLPG